MEKDNEEIQAITIEVTDNCGNECLDDKCSVCDNDGKTLNRKPPQGYVEIYDVNPVSGEKRLIGKSNLVLYIGRELIAERMFEINQSGVTPDYREFLCWFGVGNGGVDPADPLTALTPSSDDAALANEVPINATDSTCADFHHGFYYKHPFESVQFQQDPLNDNSYLITRITIILNTDDANGYQLSEAGLFTARSNAGGYVGDFNIFARVSFPSIVKSSSRRLTFLWYLYF